MSRLAARFEQLRERGEKALVTYAMAGDPAPQATVGVVCALEQAGADIVELGVPFSDPLADGPSIQAAAHRAIDHGANVGNTLTAVEAIRHASQVPIVLMTYLNPVLRYGPERFARRCADVGVDGAILVDVIPEEADEWLALSRPLGLDTVFLVAPTSPDARIRVVAGVSTGFVYCVSRTGVTGARGDVPADLPDLVARVREATPTPICVGFGVSRAEHVRQIGAFADGVVVGSAIVDAIARCADGPDVARAISDCVRPLKEATLPA